MSAFSRNWERKESRGFASRFRDGLRNSGPVKPRIDQAVRDLQIQLSKLDAASARIKSRGDTIFGKTVSALQKHDGQHAAVYANELSEVRRMGRMIAQASLALEQVVLRLGTITEMGDVAAALAPTVSVIREVRESLGTIIPETSGEMNEISTLLSSILVDAGTIRGSSLNFEAANEEAERTLEEAAIVAEQRMKERFPEIPASVAMSSDEDEAMTV
jgi:division protein CdvB (Snf7/Vps24/ESCRT-III family)